MPRQMKALMSRALIIAGLLLLGAGLLWPLFEKIGLGRLPGDFLMESPRVKFYFPLASSLLVSLILSGLLGWLRKF